MPPAKKNTPAKATDQVEEVTPAAPVEAAPSSEAAAAPVQAGPMSAPDPDEKTDPNFNFATVENHDDTDVAAALARQTQDGKGDDEVPPADFRSFATEGVEEEDQERLEVLANEALQGIWGHGEDMRTRLKEAGHNPSSVQRVINRRLANGAPTMQPTTLRDDAASVIRGEWGYEGDEIERNLKNAGKNFELVKEEVSRQLGG